MAEHRDLAILTSIAADGERFVVAFAASSLPLSSAGEKVSQFKRARARLLVLSAARVAFHRAKEISAFFCLSKSLRAPRAAI